MIVPAHVEDDLGVAASARHSCLRYEVSLGYVPSRSGVTAGQVKLVGESLLVLSPEAHDDAGAQVAALRFPHSEDFAAGVVVGGAARREPYMSTAGDGKDRVVMVFGEVDPVSPPPVLAPGIRRPTSKAGRTVLSTIASVDHPTILAARREMQSWRLLALEPSSLARARTKAEPTITPSAKPTR